MKLPFFKFYLIFSLFLNFACSQTILFMVCGSLYFFYFWLFSLNFQIAILDFFVFFCSFYKISKKVYFKAFFLSHLSRNFYFVFLIIFYIKKYQIQTFVFLGLWFFSLTHVPKILAPVSFQSTTSSFHLIKLNVK